jgi:hypothetical protein
MNRRRKIRPCAAGTLFVATMAVCRAIAPSVDALLQSNSVAVVIATAIGLALAAKYASDAARPELM